MSARFVIVDSQLYRELIAQGWIDTGFRRYWCGGDLVTTILREPDDRG